MKEITLKDLVTSDVAKRKKIDNNPTLSARKNLQWLVDFVIPKLQTLIESSCKGEITITSGYRSQELNDIVGGVAGSYHTHGLAIDFSINTAKPERLMQWIYNLEIPFDELIWYPKKKYYHLQFRRKTSNRSRILVG